MAAVTFEEAIIEEEGLEPGKLIWRRYRLPAPGVLETFYDINPHLRHAMADTLYLPVGAVVLIPIDHDLLTGRPQSGESVRMWGTSEPGR